MEPDGRVDCKDRNSDSGTVDKKLANTETGEIVLVSVRCIHRDRISSRLEIAHQRLSDMTLSDKVICYTLYASIMIQ